MPDIREIFQHWLEIDLDKLAANLAAVQSRLAPGVGVIAVVKNDAYGFGAAACAQTFAAAGCAMLAVTTLEEALELRQAGITTPVLVFLPPRPEEMPFFDRHRLTATVDSRATAQLLGDWPDVQFHLKLNTGMNRFGVDCGQPLADLLPELAKRPGQLTGVYSHLATALEPEEQNARRQIARFAQAREQILAALEQPEICFHLANSAGCLRFPESHFNAVRLGSVLYGQLGLARQQGLQLAEPFVAKARVAALRDIAKGEGVGYSREFIAPRAMRLAVIPYGYGDGFGVQPGARPLTVKGSVQNMSRDVGRLLLGRYHRCVYYQGQELPVLGRVAMQSLMVDIGQLPVQVGDVVEVPLRRTAASARLPRVYLRQGQAVASRCLVAAELAFGGSCGDLGPNKP